MNAVFSIASSDRLAGKSNVPVTLGFTPLNAVPPGGTITLSYPASFFLPSVTPVVAAGASSVAGLTATCGATTNTSIVITTAGAAIPSLAAFTLTLSGICLEPAPVIHSFPTFRCSFQTRPKTMIPLKTIPAPMH